MTKETALLAMMKAWIVLLLVALATLGSCSIEKRLYNRGWHVEFHRKKSSSVEKTRSLANVILTDQNTPVSSVVTDSIPLIIESDQMLQPEIAQVRVTQPKNEKKEEVVCQPVQKAITCFNHIVSKKKDLTKQTYKRWDREGKRASMIMVGVLLLLGIIGLIAVIVQLQTVAFGGELLGLLFLVFILGILDFTLMLILLAMSFTQTNEQESEKANKKDDDMTPEEREQYGKAQAKNGKEGKIAAGFVVIVLLLILGVAVF